MNANRLWNAQARWAPYLFVLPFVLLFGLFLGYPLARSLVLSFYKTAGPRRQLFVGLDNYRFLMSDRVFWWAAGNTALFTAVFALTAIPLSLGLAVLLNSRRVRGRSFFRLSFFSTHLVGQVFVAVIFSLLLAKRHGLVNETIRAALPGAANVGWLENPRLVMLSTLTAALWLSVGYGMIYFLAALQAVDPELYDAAHVDGAGAWSKFRHVTLPGIRPVLVFLLVLATVGSLQLFELPYVLFGGPGPRYGALTLVMYLFMTGFEAGDLGYAAAIGWMLVILVAAASLALLALRTRRRS